MTHVDSPQNGTTSQPEQMSEPTNRPVYKAPKPCDRCRSQHLKCVYTSDRCQRCERSGSECIRSRKGLRFRGVPASKFRRDRATSRASQMSAAGPSKTTPELQSHLSHPAGHPNNPSTSGPNIEDSLSIASIEDECIDQGHNDSTIEANGHGTSELREGHQTIVSSANDTVNDSQIQTPSVNVGAVPTQLPGQLRASLTTPSDDGVSATTLQGLSSLTRVFSSDGSSIMSSYASPYRWMVQAPTSRYLDGIVKPITTRPTVPNQYLETILLRYFHDELAPWFDLCDPDCHFATVVLQKARDRGPLRNAMLTIAARNLARNKRFRDPAGTVRWHEHVLPELTEEFAVPYHNECIRDLLQLSMHPKNLHDETLLAAIIALRTDEEMGLSEYEEGEDQQLFLKIASVFIDAQVPPMIALPHSSPTVFYSTDCDTAGQQGGVTHPSPAACSVGTSPSTQTDPDLGSSGLRQACFWTAFRQELHASFLKQQPVRFPLARCDAFRQLIPTIDAVWANRMVTFCADVLEFCYGSESRDGKVSPAYTSRERWHELRSHERRLCALLPASFEPTYCSEPNATLGSVFPEIWYLDPCHVIGTTYVELARMLLEVFNPTRPQLGHGFLAATNAFISSTKKILFRLCGIALSNRHCPPTLINACIGISIFGEYFGEPEEQDALLGVLALMAERYAYPTRRIALSLKKAWNREDIGVDAQYLPVSRNHMETG